MIQIAHSEQLLIKQPSKAAAAVTVTEHLESKEANEEDENVVVVQSHTPKMATEEIQIRSTVSGYPKAQSQNDDNQTTKKWKMAKRIRNAVPEELEDAAINGTPGALPEGINEDVSPMSDTPGVGPDAFIDKRKNSEAPNIEVQDGEGETNLEQPGSTS